MHLKLSIYAQQLVYADFVNTNYNFTVNVGLGNSCLPAAFNQSFGSPLIT